MIGCLTLSLKREKVTSSLSKKSTCGKCGKKNYGECLVGTDNFFGCGKSVHKVRYFPNIKGQDKGSRQAQASSSNVDDPKKNYFYALCSKGEQESYRDVVDVTSLLY